MNVYKCRYENFLVYILVYISKKKKKKTKNKYS